jgi:hypothetical protein
MHLCRVYCCIFHEHRKMFYGVVASPVAPCSVMNTGKIHTSSLLNLTSPAIIESLRRENR